MQAGYIPCINFTIIIRPTIINNVDVIGNLMLNLKV